MSEIREFLISRRANVTPAQVDLPAGGNRRVPGLRREEVAVLAGVSTDYYTKLERGKITGASESILNAVARALQLDDVERAHLFDLARPAVRPVRRTTGTLRESLRRMLDSMATPAIAYDAAQDIVGANLLGRAMYAQLLESDRPNLSRFAFLDPRSQEFYDDWPEACSLNAAMLRFEVGRDPLNPALTALVGELSTLSPVFRRHWADQHVHEHRTGDKIFHHPEVGPLAITYDVLDVPGEPGLSITSYTAAPDSPTAERFALLASWAATQGYASRPAPDPTRAT